MNVKKPIKHFTSRTKKHLNNAIDIRLKIIHEGPENQENISNTNTIELIAVGILIITVVVTVFSYSHFPQHIVSGIAGIGYNLIGAIWIASGVYLDKITKLKLEHSIKSINLNQINKILKYASKKIFIGVLYMICGSLLQILAVASRMIQSVQVDFRYS